MLNSFKTPKPQNPKTPPILELEFYRFIKLTKRKFANKHAGKCHIIKFFRIRISCEDSVLIDLLYRVRYLGWELHARLM